MHLHCSFLQEKPVSQGTAPGQEQRHVVVFQVKGEVQLWVFEQSQVLVVGLKVLPAGQLTWQVQVLGFQACPGSQVAGGLLQSHLQL